MCLVAGKERHQESSGPHAVRRASPRGRPMYVVADYLHLSSPSTTHAFATTPQSIRLAGKMSEEKGKGISLRKSKKRSDKSKKGGPPVISAPRQISAPMPAGFGGAKLPSVQNSGRPSNESSRSGQRLDAPRPRERPQRPGQDKTADLVKRRYSQKITQLPSDFGNGMPLPDLPQIPSQFRDAPPSRDGRPPGSSDGRSFKPDRRQLADDNLKPDQCKYAHLSCLASAHKSQTSASSSPMLPRTI